MRARVRLFAAARQRAGRPIVEVDLPEGATVADLRAALGVCLPDLIPILTSARFSVDEEYADDGRPIAPDAELALIPPVSGGSEDD